MSARSTATLVYFDGRREARLQFGDGKLTSTDIRALLNFEEDRQVFAGVFQFFYLRLAIFFGCLGIFMNLFRGEMLDKTLHFWFLAPARREVLLAGKYGAGLIASAVIFAGGALLCFRDDVAARSGRGAGLLERRGHGARLLVHDGGRAGVRRLRERVSCRRPVLRNPIIPAAVLLGWESINGFLPRSCRN